MLHAVINQHSLWLDAAQRTSARYGLLQHPPCSLADLPLQTLRALALQPYRWEALLRTRGTSNVNGGAAHALSPRSSVGFQRDEEGYLELLHLVPGGRYLVTTNDQLKAFSLRDLGLPGAQPQQPRIVAQVALESTPSVLNVSFRGSVIKVGIRLEARPSMYVLSLSLAASPVRFPLGCV